MKRKITLSLVSLFVLFALGVAAASWHVQTTTEQLRRLVDLHEVEGLRRALVISVQTVQGDLYTAHTPMGHRLDSIVINVEEMEAAAKGCLECHHSLEIQTKLTEIDALVDDYKSHLSYYITAAANRDRIERIQLDAAAVGTEILVRTEEMSSTASARLDEITRKATLRIDNVRIILLATLLGATVLGIGVSLYLVRSITRPVGKLVQATRVIALGNLDHRIELREKGEFGELSQHFNAMSGALKEGYDRLRSANVELRHEIRQRMQAEQEREELQRQLWQAQKMQALGRLAAGIAHEFNNSLQVIQGCVDSIEIEAAPDAPCRRDLDVIDGATQRTADLTRRLLTFGREGSSRPVAVDLNERVIHVEAVLERTLPATIEIRTKLAPGIPAVSADPAQIEQVLLNLALNAKDAMPEGGRLEIETEAIDLSPDGGEPGSPRTGGKGVLLRVSDTGHGMEEETLHHVFEPFFTTKEIGEGTGLGLATVYGIVAASEGQISCSSEPGRGTAFEIRLPALAVEVAAPPERTRTWQGAARSCGTLLLVDDEAVLLDVMRRNLEQSGYVVHTAPSGEEAIRFFEERGDEVDLVLLDLGMPGMGGRACLAKLLQARPDAFVVISTAYGTHERERELRQAGAAGFLTKPYRVAEVRSTVDALLQAREEPPGSSQP